MIDDTPEKLRAEDNPWFLLATLYGQPPPGETQLKFRNRMAWNRYMANALSRERREELVDQGRCSKEEMVPIAVQEIDAAFSKPPCGLTPDPFSLAPCSLGQERCAPAPPAARRHP